GAGRGASRRLRTPAPTPSAASWQTAGATPPPRGVAPRASRSVRGWTATRSCSSRCSGTARLQHDRLVLVELRLVPQMLLELADAVLSDVDEPGALERMPQGVAVVDEPVTPGAHAVVDDEAGQRRLRLGNERVGRPAHVAALHVCLLGVIEPGEPLERRRRDPDPAAGAQDPPAFAQAGQPFLIREVL